MIVLLSLQEQKTGNVPVLFAMFGDGFVYASLAGNSFLNISVYHCTLHNRTEHSFLH